MKNILDSIIKVEQDLQKQIIDTRSQANVIIEQARREAMLLDSQYEENFEKFKSEMRSQLYKEIEGYKARLSADISVEMEKIRKQKDKHIDKIKKEIINTVLDIPKKD